ncbi:hypothetical protein [Phytoactinopolyspora mesophila]|uniref:TIGR04222 domain-containing membrane protein n=1 Tax=Phytoactinopolyspora mesophila TaxID=2650750 RepID=A0A7K3LXR8_9ACTN|nr:hypothetical protein [Phytoactinopolyspora mesophila]NDL55813.1 hypothetical protein [Phytoactinopolyspora mesophila]
MTFWWIAYGLVLALGFGSAWGSVRMDRRSHGEEAARIVDQSRFDLAWTGMLSGGVARAIDAHVVRLAELGFVRGDAAGRLTITPGAEQLLAEAWKHACGSGVSDEDVRMLELIRDVGQDGLDHVRRLAPKDRLRHALAEFVRHDLVVSPVRQAWGPTKVAFPMLAGLAACLFGALRSVGSYEDLQDLQSSWTVGLAGVLGVASSVAAAHIYAKKRGYSGVDPKTALGREVLEQLRVRLPREASEAHRVAVGGFSAMHDAGLRRSIQGTTPDSRWSARSRRGQGKHINGGQALLVARHGQEHIDAGEAGD